MIKQQQGNIIIIIMVVMFVSVALISALINSHAVREDKAIEESLAKIKIHWAVKGNVEYFISRLYNHIAAQSDDCLDTSIPPMPIPNCYTKTDFQAAFNNYPVGVPQAVQDVKSIRGTIPTEFTYPDGEYKLAYFSSEPSSDSGNFIVAMKLNSDNPDIPVLQGLNKRIPSYIFNVQILSVNPIDINITKYYRTDKTAFPL